MIEKYDIHWSCINNKDYLVQGIYHFIYRLSLLPVIKMEYFMQSVAATIFLSLPFSIQNCCFSNRK